MPANLWKSLTVRFIALGHSLREAECIAAVIVIDCLMMYTIMGYRFGDAEREGSPVFSLRPKTRSMTLPGNCGTVPEGVDRGRYPFTLSAGSGTTGQPRGIERNPG